MGNVRYLAFVAAAGLVLAAAVPVAHAHVLNAPGLVTPDDLTVGAGSTLLGDTGLQTLSTATFTGTIEEWVWRDPTRGNHLDFTITVSNDATSTDSISRVTASDFSGFLLDVGNPGGTGGVNAPAAITRNKPGDDVGFLFGLAGLDPGLTSALLTIDTNAFDFKAGRLAVIDSISVNAVGFQPSVPEPSTWAMMLLGFAGLGYAGYRTSRKSVSIVG
jgi:PEP-CTERM motif